MEEEDKILDLPEEKRQKPDLIYIFWSSLPFFGYWFIAQLLHWPCSWQALIIGASLLYLFILLRFVGAEGKYLYQYFYFTGKSLLLAGTVLRLLNFYISFYLFLLSAIGFGIGVSLTFFRRAGNDYEQ